MSLGTSSCGEGRKTPPQNPRTIPGQFLFMCLVGVFLSRQVCANLREKKAHKLQKILRDTRRAPLGHQAGQTGVHQPVSQQLPAVCCRIPDRKGQSCREHWPGVPGTPGPPAQFSETLCETDCLCKIHVYLNSVQQMVSGELAGEHLQTGFERHGLPPQRAPLDTVYTLRQHLDSVQ